MSAIQMAFYKRACISLRKNEIFIHHETTFCLAQLVEMSFLL